MSLTTDRNNPELGYGVDNEPVKQNKTYLVLSQEEIDKGYIKPYRTSYIHEQGCGALTTMGHELSATYARDPWFYGATYCCGCYMHRPLSEFIWTDGESMDPREWPAEETMRIVELRKQRRDT